MNKMINGIIKILQKARNGSVKMKKNKIMLHSSVRHYYSINPLYLLKKKYRRIIQEKIGNLNILTAISGMIMIKIIRIITNQIKKGLQEFSVINFKIKDLITTQKYVLNVNRMVIFQKIVTRANPVVNKEHKLIIKDKTEIIIIIEEMIKIDFKERDHKKIRMEIINIIITEIIVKIKMAIMDNLDKE